MYFRFMVPKPENPGLAKRESGENPEQCPLL
jgi:hypothetical protein